MKHALPWIAVVCLFCASPAAGEEAFSADLTGDQEVPNAVVTEASGTASLALNAAQDTLTYTISLTGVDLDGSQTPKNNLDDVIGLHFHNAPAGVNGSIVFGIIGPAQDGDDRVIDPVAGTVTGAWDAADTPVLADFVEALRDQEMYLNVHTPGNSSGEIRGQIVPDPALFAADLTGDQEVPDPVETEAMGMAMLVLNSDRDMLGYSISLVGVDLDGNQTPKNNLDDVIGLHFHNAPAGVNGAVVFGIIGPAQDDDDRVIDAESGTVTGVWDDADTPVLGNFIDALFQQAMYVNVHTVAETSGEIRGQIIPVPEPAAAGVAALLALGVLRRRAQAP